jgi:RNA polymerase sigma factor (sigma-70 family)
MTEPSRPSDGELLAEFLTGKGQTAFVELVNRHGKMVHGVALRVLADHHEAQDVAQAAFLILTRKASGLCKAESVGGWLHKVAWRVALDVQRSRRSRQQREEVAMHEQPAAVAANPDTGLFRAELDAALNQLPERYRQPLVLFHLEGGSLDEVGRMLGLNPNTLRTRLARARELLRKKLVRRGVTVGSASALTTLLSAEAGAAVLPATFISATVQAASLAATGKLASGVGTGAVSANVAALTKGAIQMMFWNSVKTAAVVTAAVVVVGGAGVTALVAVAKEPTIPEAAASPAAVTAAPVGLSRAELIDLAEKEARRANPRLGRGIFKPYKPDGAVREVTVEQIDGNWKVSVDATLNIAGKVQPVGGVAVILDKSGKPVGNVEFSGDFRIAPVAQPTGENAAPAEPKGLPPPTPATNDTATIAWGEAVNGVQIGFVPLGASEVWADFQCARHALERHAMPSPEKRMNALKTRCCEICGAPKPWSATFVEGEPLVFEVHLRNAGDKNVLVGGVHHWFTFVFTPAGGGVPRQATFTPQVPMAPPGSRDLPGNGYLALVEGVGGGSFYETWKFEDARPNQDKSRPAIPALPPGKYSVTARYGEAHPEHAPDAPCRFWHGKIATGPVEIEIKPGAPETDAQRQARQAAEAMAQTERKPQIDRERELKERAIRER